MKLSSLAQLCLVAAPVHAGLVSFAVPKTIRYGDDITVTITMNSEQGYTADYVLELGGTDDTLPYGYLGGRPFAAIDLTNAPLGESNRTISTRWMSLTKEENGVLRGAVHGTRGIMGMVVTGFKEASSRSGSETSREYSVSKNLYPRTA